MYVPNTTIFDSEWSEGASGFTNGVYFILFIYIYVFFFYSVQ